MWVLRRLDPVRLWAVLRTADGWGLLAACAVFGTGLTFASWRWHLMLRYGGHVIHPGATLRASVIGHCFHTLLFGAAGGDVVKSGIYARWYGLKMSEVVAAAPLDRMMALVGAILFGLSAMLLGAFSGGFEGLAGRQILFPILWMGAVVLLALLAVVALGRWRGTRIAALDRFRATLQQSGARLLADRATLLKSALAAFLVHACLSLTMVICLASVTQVTVSWLAILWLFPVISMVAGLPVSIGGAGLREGSAMMLLGLFQIPSEDAVAASLFTLAISFGWCSVGLILWWQGERTLAPSGDEPLPTSISVVIPTVDEIESLEATVRSVRQVPEVIEVCVADGGSQDGTTELADRLGCRVFSSAPGRGTQMRVAAQHVQGDVVWLLHADTRVPAHAGRDLLNTFRDRRVVGGGFWKTFDQSSVWMLGSRFRCLIRLYLGGRLLGDQAMYIRRRELERMGGVPDLPLMEEFELCRSLRRQGCLALADSTVVTSARKFRGLGTLRTYWLMGKVTLRYYLGTPVKELAEMYAKR